MCSPNFLTALQRLARYKTLVAPMRLDITEEDDAITAELVWLDTTSKPPASLAVAESLFLLCLARLGTHDRIEPTRVVAEAPPSPADEYEKFVGVRMRRGKGYAVTFSRRDATQPFLSANDAMWAIFEPELRRRLGELDASATTSDRVRASLLEGLPAGEVGMDSVARRLALSKRTLQRRLEDEGTSFQDVLRSTRESLAVHYLQRTALPVGEISFLLGFEEPNSFYRAFGEWMGRTPETVRRARPAPGTHSASRSRPR